MSQTHQTNHSPESIRVTFKVFGGLRQLRTSSAEERTLPAGSTVEQLWTTLSLEDPAFVAKLREGLTNGYLHVLVNGRNVVFLDGLETHLNDNDTVAVLPPIGGG
jgi:molybdopterin synthase sulfur carrier subunit